MIARPSVPKIDLFFTSLPFPFIVFSPLILLPLRCSCSYAFVLAKQPSTCPTILFLPSVSSFTCMVNFLMNHSQPTALNLSPALAHRTHDVLSSGVDNFLCIRFTPHFSLLLKRAYKNARKQWAS